MSIKIRPFGPLEMPKENPEISSISLKEAYELAQSANDYITEKGILPSFLKIGDSRLGTGSLFALFCSIYLDTSSGSPATEYTIPNFDPYPRTNEEEIVQRITNYKTWPVHHRDLDMSSIIEKTKLQFWTLKPAHKK